jgi:predicted molibdopterin-dependent oxidoreductase YjgC
VKGTEMTQMTNSNIPISVTIDGQVISVTSTDKNIVDVASRAKIAIPAPCYRAKQSKGCCSACVVEIDGEQKFACSTVPENGMNIVVDRADIKAIRKQRLLKYKEGIKSGNPCKCDLSGSGDCCS